MTWTTPILRTTGDLVTVSTWNSEVVENLEFLGTQHDHNGHDGDGAKIAFEIPTEIIGIFDTSCPSGWTRVSAFDDKLIRMAPTYGGTGGYSAHSHEQPQTVVVGSWYFYIANDPIPPTATIANYELIVYDYPSGSKLLKGISGQETGSTTVKIYGSHSFLSEPSTAPSGLGGTSEPYPPYIDVVFCKKD